MLPFIQIDWGDLCSSVEEVNLETTVEEGVNWGITLESGKEVMHKQLFFFFFSLNTSTCDCTNVFFFYYRASVSAVAVIFLHHILIFLCQYKEPDDGGIDWGETVTAAVEIKVVAAGTDCKYIFAFCSKLHISNGHNVTSRLMSQAGFTGPDGVARGEDALSLLENPQTRSQFIDELMEVLQLNL